MIAAGLVLSRRPDALTHAQFWAEDGRFYFADVYNNGLWATLVVPQAGYFQTFPVLAAGLARLVALGQAPLVMNALALGAQVLPVGLLLSRRAATVAPDLRVRVLLAFLYLAVPSAVELDVTAVNAQWHLAVAALLVLVSAPPQHSWERWLDRAILLLSGLTGPFCLLLCPLAWVQRRLRGVNTRPASDIALLAACAVLQIASLLVISHHPLAGPAFEPRPNPSLGATPALFAQLVGGRLLLGTIIGAAHGLAAPILWQWLALVIAIAGLGVVARARRHEPLLVVVAFGGVLLVASLLGPSLPSPAWPILASSPGAGERYFFIPALAVLALLVWAAAVPRMPVVRVAAAALVAVSVVVAISHWSYPRFAATGFPEKAAAFERAPRGTTDAFVLNPFPGFWTMTLTKHS